MANDIQTLVIPVDATADDCIVFKCSDIGGAVTITEAYAVNHATTSGTATYSVALHKRDTSGTVISGTDRPSRCALSISISSVRTAALVLR